MSKRYFDMGRDSFRDEFDIIPIETGERQSIKNLSWYAITGFAPVAPRWQLTYVRPDDWTDEEWEEFCQEMEEDVGDQARPE